MPPRSLSSEPIELEVGPDHAGWRLDLFLAHHFPNYSRVHLRRVITAGGVRMGDRGGKPSYRLRPGEHVSIVLPDIPREAPQPEDIPLEVLYDDDWFAVVNKPPGMVVHPARGHWSGTLASAIQFHFGGKLSTAGGPSRPGIVHRLDQLRAHHVVLRSLRCGLQPLDELAAEHVALSVERDVTLLPLYRLESVVDHHAQEPGSERPGGIELVGALIAAEERLLHNVLGQGPVSGDQNGRLNRLHLVSLDQGAQPGNAARLEPSHGLRFVHVAPFSRVLSALTHTIR